MSDGDIFFRPHVITNCPVDHRRIPDIDVVIYRDADLGVAADKTRAGVQGAPGVRLSRVFHLDHTIGLTAAAYLVVDRHIDNRGLAAIETKEFIDHLLRAGVLDLARLARWKLAHQRRIDRVAPVRDAGDVHKRRNAAMAHVAGILAERSFRLDPFGGYFSLDDDLRRRWNQQIDSLTLNHFDRLAGEPT